MLNTIYHCIFENMFLPEIEVISSSLSFSLFNSSLLSTWQVPRGRGHSRKTTAFHFSISFSDPSSEAP